MTHTVNTKLSRDLRRFGAADISACFNCGNCTAVCQHSDDSARFPRRLIRYGQLGMADRLIGAKEAWLCWNCRDCSDTCPRGARPSEFMEATRRYTIAAMDPTGISRLMYTSNAFLIGFALLLAALFTGLLLSEAGTPAVGSFDLFGYIPFALIHDLGIAVLVAMGLIAVVTTARLTRHLARTIGPAADASGVSTGSDSLIGRLVSAARAVLDEMVAQRRFRACEVGAEKPVYLRPWFIHYCMMWGFIGLAGATAFDFLFKTPGEVVPLWYPARLLGTLAGLVLVYGASITIWRKARPEDRTQPRPLAADWLFLGLLEVVALTGFVLEAAVYFPVLAGIGYPVFLVHVVLAMELLALLPFMKFAHVVYRPLAYGIHRFRGASPRGSLASSA